MRYINLINMRSINMADLSIKRIGESDYSKTNTQVNYSQDEEQKKKFSLFYSGPQVAYMPIGGIGSLLNGSQNQPTQSAVQA